jgi:two-component system cell cycle sensor histidine kinase/response regulator CckA
MLFALAAGDVGIWELDLLTRTFTWSDTFERIHGCGRGKLDGTHDGWYRCVHPEDRPALQAALEPLLRLEGTDSEVEYRALWSNGAEHYIIMKGRVFRDPSGVPTGVGGVAIDATERRQLEAQLLQSQKMEAIGMLAGGVAHDFNNLLTAILGYVELVEVQFPPESRGMRDVQQIRKSATRAAHLTRQLLAFSRRQVLRPALIDLNTLVRDLANMLRRLIGEDVTLTLALDPDLARVKADPGQIEQVIMNLVVNARDAMPRGGVLTITTATLQVDEALFRRLGVADHHGVHQMVKISVRDTGIGMDAATRKHIFEPFFTTKPRGKGTGLGLATVYGIVTQSGGFVDVESAPGEGTTFDVLLPLAEPEIVPASDSRGEAAEVRRGTETIMLVEDDDDVRTLVRTLLEGQGYRVIDVANAESALVFAGAEGATLHLLISDVVLPGLSGPELFDRLHGSQPDLRVLYVSGYTDERIVARGGLAPDAPYLEKPFTGVGLTRKVRDVLDAGSSPRP